MSQHALPLGFKLVDIGRLADAIEGGKGNTLRGAFLAQCRLINLWMGPEVCPTEEVDHIVRSLGRVRSARARIFSANTSSKL